VGRGGVFRATNFEILNKKKRGKSSKTSGGNGKKKPAGQKQAIKKEIGK